MNLFKLTVALTIYFSSCLPLAAADSAVPKYGPKEKPIAVPLSLDHRYLQNSKHLALDFWALVPFYVGQRTEYSCSSAAVSIILNGLLRQGILKNNDKNITETDLIEKVTGLPWKARISALGENGKHGLDLGLLKLAIELSLKAFSQSPEKYHVLATRVTSTDKEQIKNFSTVLEKNNQSAADFVLIHFAQDVLTQSPGGPYPHISPIGAYDEKTKQVLIMDVDREWYQPYWVPLQAVIKAMAAKTDAFGYGGYILVGGNP